MFDCQAFNWAVSVTAEMDSVTGSRNPQRYSLIQAYFTNLCCNEQMVISQWWKENGWI